MTEQELFASQENEGMRLDKFIVDTVPSLSRNAVQKLMDEGHVLLNSKPVQKSVKVKNGDRILISVPEPDTLEALPQNIPVEIVFEDEYLLVVNKPKGMVVHPAPGNPDGTLVNALLYHCSGRLSSINGVIRPGIVHRIDKNTSGLLIVAKTDEAHTGLSEQIKEHSFKREYRGIVTGHMPLSDATVDVPLGRSVKDRKKQAPNGLNPRNAVTHYSVLESFKRYDYCKFILETGRTHQIRVHCAYLGHPIAGDTVYGGSKLPYFEGQCLHAAVIGFVHPISGEYLEFTASLPDYFSEFLSKINKES